jgi:hypothetical protein
LTYNNTTINNEITWKTLSISNTSKLLYLDLDIYVTSNTKMMCNSIDEIEYTIASQIPDETNLKKIKADDNHLYKIYNNHVTVDNISININNIENIVYDNYKYYFMSNIGLSATTQLTPLQLSQDPLFVNKQILDVWGENYVTPNGYSIKQYKNNDKLVLSKTKYDIDYEINNLKNIDGEVTFTDENN